MATFRNIKASSASLAMDQIPGAVQATPELLPDGTYSLTSFQVFTPGVGGLSIQDVSEPIMASTGGMPIMWLRDLFLRIVAKIPGASRLIKPAKEVLRPHVRDGVLAFKEIWMVLPWWLRQLLLIGGASEAGTYFWGNGDDDEDDDDTPSGLSPEEQHELAEQVMREADQNGNQFFAGGQNIKSRSLAAAGNGTLVFNGRPSMLTMDMVQAMAVKTWVSNGVRMWRLWDGRGVALRLDGTFSVWRYKKPIVIYRGGVKDLRTMLEVGSILHRQAKKLKKFIKVHG